MQGFQLVNQRLGYIDITNAVELSLYILSLILTLDFQQFSLESIGLLTNGSLASNDTGFLVGLQRDTGLRQVNTKEGFPRFSNVVPYATDKRFLVPTIHKCKMMRCY